MFAELEKFLKSLSLQNNEILTNQSLILDKLDKILDRNESCTEDTTEIKEIIKPIVEKTPVVEKELAEENHVDEFEDEFFDDTKLMPKTSEERIQAAVDAYHLGVPFDYLGLTKAEKEKVTNLIITEENQGEKITGVPELDFEESDDDYNVDFVPNEAGAEVDIEQNQIDQIEEILGAKQEVTNIEALCGETEIQTNTLFFLKHFIKTNEKTFTKDLLTYEESEAICIEALLSLKESERDILLELIDNEEMKNQFLEKAVGNIDTTELDFSSAILAENFIGEFVNKFILRFNEKAKIKIDLIKEEIDNMEPILKDGEELEISSSSEQIELLDQDFIGLKDQKEINFINECLNQRGRDRKGRLTMGNGTFALDPNVTKEIDGETLYEVIYLEDTTYIMGGDKYVLDADTRGGFVSKKAFIKENVMIFPDCHVMPYVMAERSCLLQADRIEPFSRILEEHTHVDDTSILLREKTPYTINEDKVQF